jgi:outer membrane protein TolC
MRWKSFCWGLALLLAATAGCKQRLFITQDDYDYAKGISVAALETDPRTSCKPTLDVTPPPPTVNNPEQEIRLLALAEAIAIALETGTVGSLGGPQSGQGLNANDSLGSFTGRGFGGSDAIRVLALDPATVGAGIEASLSKFDAIWTSGMNWSATDRPIGTALDAFQAGSAALNAIVQQDATFSTALLKPLPTGGVAGITFNLPYTFTNLASRVNPSYRPQLQFAFEQPLLQGFGVELNQIRPNHPGDILNLGAFNTQPTVEGILITRIRFDQQRAEFERNVDIMLANVEIAYWNLYSSYWTLYSQEAALRQAYEAWRATKAKLEAGKVANAALAQARGQYELFRSNRIQALNDLLESERQLRILLGLPIVDGKRLVPSDEPTLAPFQPNWEAAWQDAMTLRPELFIARQDVKVNQMNVILQKNNLLPDLRFTATYDINDIGSRLDGPDAANALRNLSSNHFNNWALGLRFTVPIGYRLAHSNLRIARLQLARSYEILKEQEMKAGEFLKAKYQRVIATYELIKALRAQREAFAEQLKAQLQIFLAGAGAPAGQDRAPLDLLLEAQRFWAAALQSEYQAIRDYNNALVSFEFARGRVLEHDNVVIAEGALPTCAQVRATEHLRERSAALELRQREVGPSCQDCNHPLIAAVDSVPKNGAASVPELWQKTPPLKDAPKLPEYQKLPESLGEAALSAPAAKKLNSTPPKPDLPPPAADSKSLPTKPSVPPALPVSRSSAQPKPPDSGVKKPADAEPKKPADPAEKKPVDADAKKSEQPKLPDLAPPSDSLLPPPPLPPPPGPF